MGRWRRNSSALNYFKLRIVVPSILHVIRILNESFRLILRKDFEIARNIGLKLTKICSISPHFINCSLNYHCLCRGHHHIWWHSPWRLGIFSFCSNRLSDWASPKSLWSHICHLCSNIVFHERLMSILLDLIHCIILKIFIRRHWLSRL